jgi:mono/diheme cytochrome c family protein
MRRRESLVVLAVLAALAACSGESEPAPGTSAPEAAPRAESPAPPATQESVRVERGRRVYQANCIACHNPDPTQPGAIGPALAGSSEALLRAKVLHNEYPPGYEPKRTSHAMIALPHLENDIPALAAYLDHAARGG